MVKYAIERANETIMRINCHRTGHNRCSRLRVHVTDNQTRYRAPPLRRQNSLRPLKNYDAMSGVLVLVLRHFVAVHGRRRRLAPKVQRGCC